MQAILGSNGVVAFYTAKELHKKNIKLRLVSRTPKKINGEDELLVADLSKLEDAIIALKGIQIAYLVVGVQYDALIWAKMWPLIMTNVIESCKVNGTKLVFLDNVYAYGKINSWMTEETPFNPCSVKGEVRAKIATQLLNEMSAGNIQAQIARSADFYGPETPQSFASIMIFERLAKKKEAQWMMNDQALHSLTYTPDIGLALAKLGNSAEAYGQTWHLPTYNEVLTGKEFIELCSVAFSCAPRYQLLKNWMLKMVGMFNPIVKENLEMLYQLEGDYLFSSEKIEKKFGLEATSYRRGVVETAQSFGISFSMP
ncbi:MAG: NAD-dependent epimerase/dehydratase family protein [bacterium]|nr:NAD-dependent epimerase/dehydratase family protein [bacterium]